MKKSLLCFAVSDLHGRIERYEKLFSAVRREKPAALFIAGDLLPTPFTRLSAPGLYYENFLQDFFFLKLEQLNAEMGEDYPAIFVILGNDDGRIEEPKMIEADRAGLLTYSHFRRIAWEGFVVHGYTCVPPTPFRLKDWERYDVTPFVRPGCIAPEKGIFTVEVSREQLQQATIEDDLKELEGDGGDAGRSIYLFHSPPHRGSLDRAGLDGRAIDGIQVDVHVGSVAIQRFINRSQPLMTIHGHIHESTRLTGCWKERNKGTVSMNASHDGPELALVRFDPHDPGAAERELL